MARVVLAMSGGVDSSVAAHLLLEQGHDVIGVFMRHGEKSVEACSLDGSAARSPLLPVLQGRGDHKQGCCSVSDAEDARRVAERLGIPFYALNLQAEFRGIIDYFVDEYARGRTPNPCVMCNNRIKFGRLFDYADSVGAPFLATGHYARLEPAPGGEMRLLRGVDFSKDQSYVLFGIRRDLLGRMMLPVGTHTKTRIRQLAAHVGLDVAAKKDSQEICFVNSGHHGEFVRQRTGRADTAGQIVTTDGRVVGEHEGFESYTVGQRKGLGVAMGVPWFVVRIEPEHRRVVIGRREELEVGGLVADATNWLENPPSGPFPCGVQIRYNSQAAEATAECAPGGELSVTFSEPQLGVAPGQAAVVYRGDQVIGGGWIQKTLPNAVAVHS